MDIVLRATAVFFIVLLVTRVVGKRELSSLEPFDVIMLVVIGDLVQQGVTQSNYSVTGAALAILTITLLSAATAYVNYRIRALRPVLEGEPVVLIERGSGAPTCAAVSSIASRSTRRTPNRAATAVVASRRAASRSSGSARTSTRACSARSPSRWTSSRPHTVTTPSTQ